MAKVSFNETVKKLKDKIQSADIIYCPITIAKAEALLINVDSLSDKKAVGELVMKPLIDFSGKLTEEELQKTTLCPSTAIDAKIDDAITEIMKGNTVLIVDGLKKFFYFDLKKVSSRQVNEPPTSSVLKGPREGFVENIQSNLSLVRQRIKSPDLKIEYLVKGKYSNTSIAFIYVKGVVKEGLVKDVKEKLSRYTIDGIMDTSYVIKILTENKGSLFKQMGTTEKPDIMCAKILEGRMAILVDGSPIAITLPYLLIEDFQSPQDYYSSVYHANISRMLRAFSIFIAVMLPSFYVSAQIFHLQLIPLSFLLTIVNGIKGIPLSPALEMLTMLVIFEILNEASLRMPKYVGMVVSIVGGLVLGETAVNAGIISAPALMIIAFSGICLYTVPDLEQVFSLLRAIFLIIAGTIGSYGLILGSCFLLTYLVSREFFETPLLAPFAPLIPSDLKDSLFKNVLVSFEKRPKVFKSKNKTRLRRVK